MRSGSICAIINFNESDEELAPLTQSRPIGTMPFGGRYRIVDFPLSAISNAGIHNVALFLPHNGRSVQDHVRSGASWDLDTINGGLFTFPFIEERDYTDVDKRQQYYDNFLMFLRKSGARYTVIMGSQDICNIDFQALLRFHLEGNHNITTVFKNIEKTDVQPTEMVLKISEAGNTTGIIQNSDLVLADDVEKVPASMDVYLLPTLDLIDLLADASKQEEMVKLNQILRDAVIRDYANAFEYTGFFAHINSLKRYYDANISILDEKNYQALLFSQQRIFTKNKNEVPTYYSETSDVTMSLIGTGGVIDGNILHSIIFRNVVINKGATVEDSIMMQGCQIGANSHLQYCILDKGVIIGPNLSFTGTIDQPLVFVKDQEVYKQGN